ncbi:MAG: alpha amylase C-terminal domain-containing protein, partial [Bacteroidota bacterium]
RTVSYVECHDQALVGGKTLMFELADKDMYTHMHKNSQSITIDRAVALHKMARLATFGTADSGYLNFMGNEFGHPEWVDFPREGNNWSYKYSRRQWRLRNNEELIYHDLGEFDKDMMRLNTDELANSFPSPVYIHNHDKLMAFNRGRLLFLFNFHPAASYSDYMIPVDRKGKYTLILDSDRKKYSGFERISPHQDFHTQFKNGDSHTPYIKVYLPSRVAMVLEYSRE